ncbi:hypothetical protein [Natranaerobius trueperi]|uniref:Group II intron reverse transcriptase/maturase n=1 Tax=Natranaerobius trueperi TaxID=759412 RepID=A0A226BWC3_9FIRM|nr:hypothetical protein [Natranaerobius trueperi]OWZ83082.1 hypothetical protein CDO51_10665 [Natranaerobius trueperi]
MNRKKSAEVIVPETGRIKQWYSFKSESVKGARSTSSLEPSEKDGAESLLDKLLHTGNLNSAYKRVKQNRGQQVLTG